MMNSTIFRTYSGFCGVLLLFLFYIGPLSHGYAQISQTITFPAITDKVYGTTFTVTATATSGLPVRYESSNPNIITISGNTVTVVGVGTAYIMAYQDGNGTYSAADPRASYVTTVKANQTITFIFNTNIIRYLGDPDITLNATASSGLPVTFVTYNTDLVTISGNTVHLKSNGTATIIASQEGNNNYNSASSVYRDIVVYKRDQTIAFDAIPTKYMDDVDFDPGAAATSGLAVTYSSDNTSVATIVAGKVHVKSPGTARITASQAGNTIYNSTFKSQTLTVSRRDQTVTFAEIPGKTIGDADFTLNATASSGLPVTYSSSNTLVAKIINGNTVQITGAGSTSIEASQDGGGGVYKSVSEFRELVVSKKTQTVTFTPITAKIMGDADFTLEATASSGLPVTFSSSNPEVATIVDGNKVHLEGHGVTILTASQTGEGIYEEVSETQDLVVTRITQTITFDVLPVKKSGDADFTLTGTASSGLAVSYTSDNTAVATIVNGNQVHIVGVGMTVITAGQTGNSLFGEAAPVFQLLYVQAAGGGLANQWITFPRLSPVNVNDGPLTLSATASSGLPVTYTSSNPGVARLSGNTLTLVAAGQTQITASQEGNAVYAAATPVTESLTVVNGVVGTEYETPGVVSIYPNPTADRVTIAASRFTQQAAVQVALVDTYGRVVRRERLHANGENEVELSISSLGDGVYILHVTQGGFEFRNRIVKIR